MPEITRKRIGNKIIVLFKGDITERDVDAIVNAANSYLQHGGGVAGAIVKKGGHIIQEESDKIGFVPVGSCAITTGGKLKARYVIHAVGPRMGEGDEENKLKSAVRSVLILATEKGLRTISMPAISSGIFGFPKDKCANILVTESVNFLKENPDTSIEMVEFCVYDDNTAKFFESEFNKI